MSRASCRGGMLVMLAAVMETLAVVEVVLVVVGGLLWMGWELVAVSGRVVWLLVVWLARLCVQRRRL